ARALRDAVEGEEKVVLVTTGGALVVLDSASLPRGFAVLGTLEAHAEDAGLELLAGRWYRDADTAVIVLNRRAAGVVAGDTAAPERALGRTIRLQGNPHEVIGIAVARERTGRGSGGDGLTGFVPVDAAEQAIAGPRVPALIVSAPRIEEVDSLRARTERWAAATYGPKWKDRLTISTNQARVAQVTAGMLVFKLLMGSITGVALLVGGIGIMNVLLAAVAERTREIGIRKATGARDRDILVQFLSESVAITSAGAAVGVALGLGIAFATAAIMRTQTSAPVRAAVTPGTIAVAAGAAVFIGVVFGLYPALRASRLSPIDAIRHE
ncbi:MAG: ABC transporter permease, partial [Gemmatimonadaceae bacterium]